MQIIFDVKNYTAQDLFDKAEEFFTGLGFDNMTSTFKKESMITRPNDREVVCHASAEEFFFGPGTNTDFREDWRYVTQLGHLKTKKN